MPREQHEAKQLFTSAEAEGLWEVVNLGLSRDLALDYGIRRVSEIKWHELFREGLLPQEAAMQLDLDRERENGDEM